jgi:hypothetical protein
MFHIDCSIYLVLGGRNCFLILSFFIFFNRYIFKLTLTLDSIEVSIVPLGLITHVGLFSRCFSVSRHQSGKPLMSLRFHHGSRLNRSRFGFLHTLGDCNFWLV